MYKTFAALALASLTALGCSGNSLSGTDPNGNGNDDGGSGNGDGGNGNGDGGIDRDAACGDVRAQATLAKSPVDVIFVVDNSGSMTLEIQSVEKNINQSFAAIIAASGLDYRVILISNHGSASADQSICISAPLASNASCTPPPAKPDPDALEPQPLEEVFEQVANESLLNENPLMSVALVDKTGARARLRSRLSSHSASGQGVIRGHVRATLSQLRRLDTDTLSAEKKLNVDVVKTVYEIAADGFDFPYGDVAILNNNWSYRNTPYVVAQNVGAFVEIPSFLDSSHSITTAADADAYLERMEAYARQLEGETVRVRADASRGVVLPDFLMAKTLQQLRASRAAPVAQWGIVTSLATRAARAKGALGIATRDERRETELLTARREWAESQDLDPSAVADVSSSTIVLSGWLSLLPSR